MEAFQAVLVALAALFVGALLPLVFQALAALREVRALVGQARPAIASVSATAERLERLTAKLEADGRVDHALQVVDSLAKTVSSLKDTAATASRLGAAVVPALAAAMEAWRASQDAPPAATSGAPPTSPPTTTAPPQEKATP